MKTSLYEHFHSDERSFVDKVHDWIIRTEERHITKITDFLDPRQAYILETLMNSNIDVQHLLFGGFEEAERKRALIAPDYMEIQENDFPIQVLSIRSDDVKFSKLTHGDFLGAILGLGIKRDKIGDLHILGNECQCIAAGEIIDYLNLNLQQVHRVQVTTDVIPLEQLQPTSVEMYESHLTVSSLRLDNIVSDAAKMSRAKILQPIKTGKCKVNWKIEEDPSTQINAGDVVSLKGFGRFKILSIEGKTKKGNVRLKIGKYI
ncbi:YlmH family RNA-binding protein [Chengkuizengella axinellae]|uniref:YlmH/Sll1252 family protein n=1 Tax=Chengkuizengella axinellae TaxID=3064388 RepID=A0ABT9IV04_9BACL|nr:YlmH/Sll1252 family protein [Chengkuizengella sp. 2205SS18-9]MDP5273170.1 YlmH/Sll1252 family protein [Chengkuizengella sp. 2205SS18-9]